MNMMTRKMLQLLLSTVTVSAMVQLAGAMPASRDICTPGFMSPRHMKELHRLVEHVRDERHDYRVLPDQDDMDNHVTTQGDASVCLFRKAVAELYVEAFSAEGTRRFMGATEATKQRNNFHSFVPSCGTAHESQHGHKFKQIMARLEKAKLELQSDEATLRKVLGEIGLLRIVCAERSDLGRPPGGRHGGARDHQRRHGGARKKVQGGSNKKKRDSKQKGRGPRKSRVVAHAASSGSS